MTNMIAHVTCDCCQHDTPIATPIPQVDDVFACDTCGAILQIVDVFFEPVVSVVVQRPAETTDENTVDD
jgi:hypothetical protein